MTLDDLDTLAGLIERERLPLLARWRQQVRELPSAKGLDVPTLNDHIPLLLDELATALRAKSDQTIPEALSEGSPSEHGVQRVEDGFDIQEVVAEYNILRGCIHTLAEVQGLCLRGQSLHVINRVLDQAIGIALQSYATQRALEVQRRREEYLSFVAHDLRTPLNAISLAGRVLELNLAQQAPEAETARMFRALRRNVQHLEGLVSKVLEENANLETEIGIKLERRQIDLWPLVEALIHDLHPIAGTDSTRLVNEVPEGLLVYADANLLRRLFQNLIANAIRYTPRGQVVLGARDAGAEGVELWVGDDGAGISPAFLERVFDKGEVDPENEGGTGLGLAIVKAIAEAHGGAVSVQSTEGIGSTFRLSLPNRGEPSATV